MNSALLSRAQIYELEPLAEDMLVTVARRGADALGVDLPDGILDLVARRAGGDARNALNILELAVGTARAEDVPVDERHVEDAATKRPLVYDRGGDAHYDFISAWIKSTRAGTSRPPSTTWP